MPINAKLLATTMFNAARPLIKEGAGDVRELLQMQLRTLAAAVTEIEQLRRSGRIDGERARLLFEMHRTAARTAMTAIESIGVATAEGLLNAATDAIGQTLLAVLGGPTTGIRANFRAGKDI